MFWRFGGYANISTLDSLLDKPDVTLEELLDESDLIQELKAQNAKLVEFLREEAVLERLLRYVIAPKPDPDQEKTKSPEPRNEENKGAGGLFKSMSRSRSADQNEAEAEKDEEKRLKYAYVACEVLSSEVYSIYESLLANPDPLRDFWQYIKQDAPLDPLQAGYFTKVNEALLEKKTEDMIAFLKNLDAVVPCMMKHVDCPMVMDLLLKLISLEKDSEGAGVVDWLQSQNLIPMLLSYITSDYAAATQTSAGDFLKAIITISANATGQDTSVIGPNELTRQLVSDRCVKQLIEEMLKGGNPLTVGVGIVIEVIRKNNSDYDSEAQIAPEPRSSDPIYLGTLLRSFAVHIPDFMELILSSRHSIATENGLRIVERSDLRTAWGDRIEPLGFDRFKTCELMAELLHCSNMGLLNEKGCDAAVKARDAERDRLKSEGKLTSAHHAQPPQADFGTSMDSTDYQHPENFTPLGESPEDVKRLEVQNGGDEEEFEKVAISEAEPDAVEQGVEPTSQSVAQSSTKRDSAELSNQVAGMELDQNASHIQSGNQAPAAKFSSSKRRQSLLSQQIEAEKSATLNPGPDTIPDELPDAKPAPLFAHRANPQVGISELPASADSDVNAPRVYNQNQARVGEDQSQHSQATSAAETIDHSEQAPVIETEDDGSPVVGDLLKIKFVENRVVPTILDFFFRFPWNNFLHNVVYDVVQQVFNGAMDRGFNPKLAIDLFETGRITERIIEGQQRSDQAQREQKMRLGYMGHLTLIAEEVVKFTERQPPELLAPSVVERITSSNWINYVEQTLTETRDRDNAILGGVRPDVAGGPRQAVLNAVNAAQTGIGNTGSAALASAGLGASPGQALDSMDLTNAGNSAYGGGGTNLLSGFGGSDDEDEEELEEGELTQSASVSHHQIDQEDQPSMIGTEPTSTPEAPTDTELTNSNPSNPASMPAPLAIPPSRARQTLAARLAARHHASSGEQQTDDSSSDDTFETTADTKSSGLDRQSKPTASAGASANTGANPAASSSKASKRTGKRLETSAVDFDSEAGENDSETDSDDLALETTNSSASASDNGDEEEEPTTRLTRQTTREASREERRPIDDDSDSSDEEQDRRTPTISSGRKADSQDEEDKEELDAAADVDVEDYWRLGELRQAARERSIAQSSARHKEQGKLLQSWGLAEGAGGDAQSDDEDEDDAPVEMGTKYLRKNRPS